MSKDETLHNLMDQFAAECQKLGLYFKDAHLLHNADPKDTEIKELFEKNPEASVKELMDGSEGKISFAFQAIFTIGDLAFSDRIQNPEAYDTDTQFRMMMPTESEIVKDKLAEKLKSGMSIMDLFDDDEDENGLE